MNPLASLCQDCNANCGFACGLAVAFLILVPIIVHLWRENG